MTGSGRKASRRKMPSRFREFSRGEGVDLIDVSAGQTSIQAQPVYGRMFQTPFSDQIRNEAGIATLAVGNIYDPDHVNSILMAGRADLVCLARPHLADPYWTLHAAADLGYQGETWPKPYLSGPRPAVPAQIAPRRHDGKSVMGALDGQHALITGGGTGIGAAIARALADAGAAITVAGRRRRRSKTVVSDCRRRRLIVADVTQEIDCAAMVDAARARPTGRSISSLPTPARPRARRSARIDTRALANA